MNIMPRSPETWTSVHPSVSGYPYAIVAFFINGAYVAVDLSFTELESLRDKINAHFEQVRDTDLRADAINNQDLLRDTELMHDISITQRALDSLPRAW